MDAITMLKDDHKTVERLFKRFEKAGDSAYTEKRKIVDEIIRELAVHAAVEEQIFYPVTRETVPKTEDIALESLEEHHIVKWVLSELDGMDPKHERFDAKVTVLMENVRHHVEEEEEEYFPMVRDELGRKALADIGEAMAVARKVAPTHPHPKAPDEPPGNLVAGTASGVVDRVGDTMSGLAQGGVSAVTDLVNNVLGRNKGGKAPTGSPDARKVAAKARTTATRTASKAASTGKSTARSAARGASKTAKAAKSGAKGTATSARKSTKRTASTAKRAATTTGRTARSAAKRTASTAKRTASAGRSR